MVRPHSPPLTKCNRSFSALAAGASDPDLCKFYLSRKPKELPFRKLLEFFSSHSATTGSESLLVCLSNILFSLSTIFCKTVLYILGRLCVFFQISCGIRLVNESFSSAVKWVELRNCRQSLTNNFNQKDFRINCWTRTISFEKNLDKTLNFYKTFVAQLRHIHHVKKSPQSRATVPLNVKYLVLTAEPP